MKIAPISAPVPVDHQAERVQSVRTLRMSTRATPEGGEPPPATDELSKPDTSDTAEGTVEASQPLSPQLAALAKQRRALQVKERELAEREKALSAQPANQEGAVDLARLKSEPLKVLLESGVTYDQLTKAILDNQDGGHEFQTLERKVQDLEASFDKKLADKDSQAEKQVLAEMRKEATTLAAEGEAFELIRATNSVDQVMELIEKTYRKSGEVLDVTEAMQLVEDELVAESLKLAALKKVQGRLKPEVPPAPQPQQRPAMRTLTNRDTATTQLTPKQRALLAFRGELKK